MEKFGRFVFSFMLGTASGLWTAFVLQQLWNWFVSPLGIPAIGYWHAYGLLGLLGFCVMFSRVFQDNEPENSTSFTAIVTVAKAIGYALSLGFGAVVHFWLMGAA